MDSHYCANCLENLPSSEARLKRNRCAACLDCPSCLNTVSTRSTSITSPNPEDPNKTITRKAYYLACAFCRWTSRDVGLPDQTVGELFSCIASSIVKSDSSHATLFFQFIGLPWFLLFQDL